MLRHFLIAVLLAASLSCACQASDCAGDGDGCAGEACCVSCVVCHGDYLAQEQVVAEWVQAARIILPVSDLRSSPSFFEVPFQPPRTQAVA